MAKSIRERQELKQWGGELISFAPTPATKFGLSDAHIRAANITAQVETSDGGTRVTATRVATLGLFALAAKEKRADNVTLVLTGNDYAHVIDCGSGPKARAGAELFAARVNAVTGHSPSQPVSAIVSAAAAAAAAESPGETADPLAQIRELADLRGAGAITDEEFASKKTELLDRL